MTKVSTKGQVVLPGPIRRRLGLRAGDSLDAHIEVGPIVLTPQQKRALAGRIMRDPLTRLPMLSAGRGTPMLSGEEVAEVLAAFP